MPRPPEAVPDVAAIADAVFSPLAGRAARSRSPSFPLHVGDTWLEPMPGARAEDLRADAHPGLHRYSETRGVPALVDALVEDTRARLGLACERKSIVVTGGATAALAVAIATVAAPGEEVLLCAPFWPLIRGIVRSARARPVEVPFYDRVDGSAAAVAALDACVGPRTVALYVSTPSNPTGRVLPGDWLEALAAWARGRGLWILSDETYERLVYRGEHVPIARFAPERTLTAFSFSKAWAMAGNRVGYLVGPPAIVREVHKVTTHTLYNAPTTGQVAALRVLEDGTDWLDRTREGYRGTGQATAATLGVEAPEGSTFLFLDVRAHLDPRGLDGFLLDCLEDGVLLAPGASSGEAYAGWVRLCYTACAPERVAEAVRRLARRLGRPPARARLAGGSDA